MWRWLLRGPWLRPSVVLALVLMGAAGAADAAPPPVALPGPPPGALSGIALPPPPGVDPLAQPDGPPVTVGRSTSGPGLLSGDIALHGTRFTLSLACATSGNARVTARGYGAGPLASARYVCRHGRATVPMSLPGGVARRIARARSVIAAVTFISPAGSAERQSIVLGADGQLSAFWSDGGLLCGQSGSPASLVAPNFTVSPPTTIDVRPWVAWYTDGGGWHWQGTVGPNASRWYRFTATPAGVAEWRGPGAASPWTWGPIRPSETGVSMIGVFEVVYWYSRPVYTWRLTASRLGQSPTTYCTYP